MDDIVVSVMYIYIIVNYMCIIIILQIDVHIVVGESMCIYIYTYTYIVSGKGLRPLHDLRLMIGLARKFSHNYMCFRLANHCTSAHNCMIYCMLIFTFISLLHSYIYTVYTLPLLRSRKKKTSLVLDLGIGPLVSEMERSFVGRSGCMFPTITTCRVQQSEKKR